MYILYEETLLKIIRQGFNFQDVFSNYNEITYRGGISLIKYANFPWLEIPFHMNNLWYIYKYSNNMQKDRIKFIDLK